MKLIRFAVPLFVVFPLVSGCANGFSPIAAHTVATGENAESDVVWVQRRSNGQMLRCTNAATGPICVQPQGQ